MKKQRARQIVDFVSYPEYGLYFPAGREGTVVSEGEKSFIVDWDDGWVGDALREDIEKIQEKFDFNR